LKGGHQVKTFKQQRNPKIVLDLAFKEVMLGDCVQHNNLAPILDIYVGDVPRLVFQWADGAMLLQMAIASQGCSGQAFSFGQKALMSRDMLNGIAYLHCRGIVHSTLRPSAVVVHFGSGRDPTHAQILDLAGAVVLETVTEACEVTALVGSLEYIAPEVLMECPALCPGSDVWSAAAVMAFVWTGQSMFGQTPADRHTAIANILSVLGGIGPEDMADLCLMPCWAIYTTETPPRTDCWRASMVAGGGPGADLLLKRMLVLSTARCFFSQTALPNPNSFCQLPHLVSDQPLFQPLAALLFVILNIVWLFIESNH
jgi:serine/threonine protein kinase